MTEQPRGAAETPEANAPNPDEMLIDRLLPRFDVTLIEHVVVTQVDSPNALPADDLAARMRPLIGAETETAGSPRGALERARELAGEDGSVLVAGSLYLVGAIRSAIAGARA